MAGTGHSLLSVLSGFRQNGVYLRDLNFDLIQFLGQHYAGYRKYSHQGRQSQ